MNHDTPCFSSVQTTLRRPSDQRRAAPEPRVESRGPWRQSLAAGRAVVEVNPARSASPFSRLDLSDVPLSLFPQHD